MIWRNSFFNLLGLGIPLLLSIATMGWLSRILSVEEFGIFLISFVSSFAFNLHKKYYTKFRLEFQLYK